MRWRNSSDGERKRKKIDNDDEDSKVKGWEATTRLVQTIGKEPSSELK
jgi:hypothetical protein